ncbi:DHA2 family efflux MFS transporter permease subunit [Agrilactobacillus fermenti]|uniref:DHA2 family efflux MFS transporter permease subunit n=1 Tax=Agrilactobacillus fermenti TaxID=2586909 RepID=UPI003A5C261A
MSFCGIVVETAMNITFPTLMKEFGVGTTAVQWTTTAYLLVVSIFVPISSFLKRRFSNRTLFIFANLCFIVGLLIDAFAMNIIMLIAGRIVQGMAAGIALPLMFNIIIEYAPLQKIGFLMDIGTLVTAIAPALGPTYGGLIVSTLTWHYIFIFLLPVMLISLIAGLYAIQADAFNKETKLDIISWLLIAIFFFGVINAATKLNSLQTQLPVFLIYLVAGILAITAFVIRSRRVTQPIINLSITQFKRFDLHLLSYFLMQLTNLGISFILPNYLQIVNHRTALIAGLLMLPSAALGAVFAPIGGRIMDRFGARKPILTGILSQLVALFLLMLFARHIQPMALSIIYILFMLGMGLQAGNIMINGLKQVPKQLSADGNALFNTAMQFAGALGTSIVSAIVAFSQQGHAGSFASRTALGAQNALILLAILAAINTISLIIALRTTKSKTTKATQNVMQESTERS